MDFELVPNTAPQLAYKDGTISPPDAARNPISDDAHNDANARDRNAGGLTDSEQAVTDTQGGSSENDETDFSFSQDGGTRGDAELAISEYIDINVPRTYRVKFNFTPEKVQRTRWCVLRVMMRLSKDRLRRLNKVWEQSEDGLDLPEFMKLMILEVPSLKSEKLEMIHGLIRLFKQVDINGDGMMQWSEFVQYIIDQVQTESIVATQDVQGNVTSIGQIIKMQQAALFHKLKRSGVPADKGRHRKPIQDVIMCPQARNQEKTVVMHSESDCTTIQWYDLSMKPICQHQLPVKGRTDKVLSIAHQDISKSLYAFGPQGTDAVFGVLCSDQILYLYIRNRGRIELFHQISVGPVLQTKVWFLPQHKTWMTVGKDLKFHQWNISPIAEKNEMGDPIQLHSDLVTDCVEIASPFCIATCSLDRTIVLYDLKNREVLRRFARKHVTGVRHLRYMEGFGGMIISTGFEIYANVWGPQNLFGNAHLGRLKGHRSPICSIDVAKARPFVFTLDDTNELIIWDMRNLSPLQVIPAPNQKDKLCHGVFSIRADLLWLYGSRFISYDRLEVFDEGLNEAPETSGDNVAINANHNQFFGTVCVQTPQDLKIYSCLDGQLMTMHQSVFKHPYINCISFRQDKRHRKAYLASSDGQIIVINIQSGVVLKRIFEDEDQQAALENSNKHFEKQMKAKRAAKNAAEKDQVKKLKTSAKDKLKEQRKAGGILTRQPSAESIESLTRAAFLTEAPVDTSKKERENSQSKIVSALEDEAELDEALMVAQQQSTKREIVDMILVWEDKMNQLIYADKQSYYVYAETDDNSEKLRTVTGGHQGAITAIKFSFYLSLIATGTETGEVAVWDYELSQLLGICQGHSKTKGEITAIEFLQPYPVMVTAGLDSKVCLWTVRPTPTEQCYVTIGMFYNVTFNYVDDTRYPVRCLLSHSGEDLQGISRGVVMKHSQINADTYRDYKTNQVLATREGQIRVDKNGNYRGLTRMKDLRLDLLKEQLAKANDGTDRTKVEKQFEEMRVAYLPRMEHMDPEYDQDIEDAKLRVYLYLGDDFGTMKLWDLTYMLKNSFVEPCRPVWEVRGDQYFPNRSETVNVRSYAARLRNIATQHYNETQRRHVKDPEDSGLIVRESVAHDKGLLKINPHNFDGLLTVAQDSQVRIWSHGLDLWGIIDCRHFEQDVLWHFPNKDRKEAQTSDILQMQMLADQMREPTEQAVLIERDSDEDDAEKDEFTAVATYKKFKHSVSEKKRKKVVAEQKAEQAMIEERREFNIAMAASKVKAQVVMRQQKNKNPNQRAIERIEELLETEKNLYDRIFYKEKSMYEIKGEVVVETSNRMDELIRKALMKHKRASVAKNYLHSGQNSGSPSHASTRRKPRLQQSAISSTAISLSKSPRKSPVGSPRRIESKLSVVSRSQSGSPTPLLRQSPRKKKVSMLNLAHQQSKTPRRQSILSSSQQEPESPAVINLKKVAQPQKQSGQNVPQLLGSGGQGRQIIKNKEASSMSMVSSIDGSHAQQSANKTATTTVEDSKGTSNSSPFKKGAAGTEQIKIQAQQESGGGRIGVQEVVKETAYEEDDDGNETEKGAVIINRYQAQLRPIEQLNQTMALLKRVEAATDQLDKAHQYGVKQDQIEDAKDDRQSLLLCKNLPSIRDKLFSIKSKQQKAFLNPKYNKANLARIAASSISPSRFDQAQNSRKNRASKASRVTLEDQSQAVLAPYLSLGGPSSSSLAIKNKTHESAMQELSVIAKDLEMFNRSKLSNVGNKIFNERARSMIVPSSEAGASKVGGSALKIGHTDVESSEKKRQSSLLAGAGYLAQKQVTEVDEEEAQWQLRAFQSQLLARDSKRHEKIRVRNMANSRTPNDVRRQQPSRLRDEGSAGQKGLQNSNSMQRIVLPSPISFGSPEPNNRGSQVVASNLKQAYGAGVNAAYQSPYPLSGAQGVRNFGLNQAQLDVSLDLMSSQLSRKHLGRNLAKKVHKTEIQDQDSTTHLTIIDDLATYRKPANQDEITAQMVSKVLGGQVGGVGPLKGGGPMGRNQSQTTAQSHNFEPPASTVLQYDDSRQYLDINLSIGESQILKAATTTIPSDQPPTYPKGAVVAHNQLQSQLLAHNMSLSQVSANLAHYSEDPRDNPHIHDAPSSFYNDEGTGGGVVTNHLLRSARARAAKPKRGSSRQLLNLSAASSGQLLNNQGGGRSQNRNWKAKRRQSEQTRLNSNTGLVENVDLIAAKKSQYMALKQKYAGKDSGLAQLAKREAENIAKQRARINELKDFKVSLTNAAKQPFLTVEAE